MITNQLLGQWNATVEQGTKMFDTMHPWGVDQEIAPQRNTVNYLIGHLTAVADRMIEALELGERIHPEMDELFIKPLDRTKTFPAYETLREQWVAVNQRLAEGMQQLSVADWMGRHHYVSAEDFAKEPHRNKMSILISRFGHLHGHLAQMRLVKQA